MEGSIFAYFEAGLMCVLGLWAIACVCYTFRVPRIHVFLNRHHRFEMFASWALATTPDIQSSPGAHSVEFCDVDPAGSSTGWKRVASSDYWVWYAFLWFPGKVVAYRVQSIGREIGYFSQGRPPATRMIAAYGSTLERFVGRLHPPAPQVIRRVRLLRRVIIDGRESERIVWQSGGSS